MALNRGEDKAYVEIPEGITHIGPDAFLELGIQHVVLPSTLLEIDNHAFRNCYKLLSVNFTRCTRLQRIGKECFMGCSNLRHVDISKCKLTELSDKVFYKCRELVIYVPPRIQTFGDSCLSGVKVAAVSTFEYQHGHADLYLLPNSEKEKAMPNDEGEQPSFGEFVDVSFTDDYDSYADVFDAIGQLNVIWIESLRRQAKIRKSGAWSQDIIIQESEMKNHVIDLWNRIKPYDIHPLHTLEFYHFDEKSSLFQKALQILYYQGFKLVNMGSYQKQPEETKLFKTILESFNIYEPRAPFPPDSPDESSKKRRILGLRF